MKDSIIPIWYTKVRRVWVQANAWKWNQEMRDKNWNRFILLKIKCSIKNPKTYIKYFPFGVQINIDALKSLEWQFVKFTDIKQIPWYNFIYKDIILMDWSMVNYYKLNWLYPDSYIIDDPFLKDFTK